MATSIPSPKKGKQIWNEGALLLQTAIEAKLHFVAEGLN